MRKLSIEERLRFLAIVDVDHLRGKYGEDMRKILLDVIRTRDESISLFNNEKNWTEEEKFNEKQTELLATLKSVHETIKELRGSWKPFCLGESDTPEPLTDTQRTGLTIISAIEVDAILTEERVLKATINRRTRPSGVAPQEDV
jgi:hypothetical protein